MSDKPMILFGFNQDSWVYKAFMRHKQGEPITYIGIDYGSEPASSHTPDLGDWKPVTITYGGRRQGKTWERFKAAIEAGEVARPTTETMLQDFLFWRTQTLRPVSPNPTGKDK